MPKQTGNTSGLAARLGAKGAQAFEAHKTDETQYGAGGGLPAGIEGGIARLTEFRFDQFPADHKNEKLRGKDRFYAAGIVLLPKMHEGQAVAGERTWIMEPLCDTPDTTRKTVEDHLARVLNEMRKLGVDTSLVSFDDLEATAAALQAAAPCFKFRTWKGEKQTEGKYAGKEPLVNHDWRGLCDEPDLGDASSGVQDNTPVATPAKTTSAPSAAPKAAPASTQVAKQTPPTTTEKFGDDLDMLIAKAMGNDIAAQQSLQQQALGLGISQDDIDNTEDWHATGALIRDAMANGEGGDGASTTTGAGDEDPMELARRADEEGDQEAGDALTALCEPAGIDVNEYGTWVEAAEALLATQAGGEETAFVPEKGGTYLYKPPGAKKPIEVTCTMLFPDKGTANLKNLDDNKTVYKGVKFELISAHS